MLELYKLSTKMSSITRNTCLILLWILFIYTLGILLFTQGFLLKRIVIERNSTCQTDFAMHLDTHGEGGCWMHPRFKKAVVIVIDALRYDFVQKNESVDPSSEKPFENKLKSLSRALEKEPQNALLFKFLADPPTTTMQRLKGLTTGSLPTFIDFSANFAGEEIREDNIIDQMRGQGKRLVFMGDDTWHGLFPNRFVRAYNYPSLNVKDLHTVDNGVIEHLLPEMATDDWDMIIAHFLGVDHCGHTFGPYHPAMADKLEQMDSVMESVMRTLDDDTLLVVLGDHGMTRTGDHGGDSTEELEAALFVYSKSRLTTSQPPPSDATIHQIDLVPTLSLLLGLPIPHGNLGMVIPSLFTHCPWLAGGGPQKELYHVVKALHVNAHQVYDYLQAYASVSSDLPEATFISLQGEFQQAESRLQKFVTGIHQDGKNMDLRTLQDLRDEYIAYLRSARDMCHEIWAKFDLGSMLLGIATVAKATALGVFMYMSVDNREKLDPSVMAALTTSVWLVLLFVFLSMIGLDVAGVLAAGVTGVSIIALFGLILYKIIVTDPHTQKVNQILGRDGSLKARFDPASVAAGCIFIIYCLSLFSNSFIVHEDTVTSFLLQSLVWIQYYQLCVKFNAHSGETGSKKAKFDIGRIITSPKCIAFVMALCFCVCIRLSKLFYACREEQHECDLSPFHQPIASLTDNNLKSFRYFISVGSLALIPIGARYLLRYLGNLNGFSPAVICIRLGTPILAAVIALSWALQAMPQKLLDSLPAWQITLLPRIAYLLVLALIAILVYDPLLLFLVKRDGKESMIPATDKANLVSNMFQHLKSSWGENKESKPPLAYGLATVYSASLLSLLVVAALLEALLLGDGLAASVTLLLAAMIAYLDLQATIYKLTPIKARSSQVPLVAIVTWTLLASQFFYTTGHQPTIANIHWNPAFVGFHGDHPTHILPAILILLETFSSHILVTIATPLLLLWKFSQGNLALTYERKKVPANEKGEFSLHEDQPGLRVSLFKLLLGLLLCYGLKALLTMSCAAVQRRHLMVWKIFAPRYMYEGVTFFIVSIACLVVGGFVLRVDSSIRRWIKEHGLTE